MSTGEAVALVALLVAVIGAPAAALSVPVASDSMPPPESSAEGELASAGPSQPRVVVGSVDPPGTRSDVESASNTTFTVRIQPNGDARWRITTAFNLSTAADLESFEALAAAFEDNETSQLGLEAFQRAATAASRETGREMVLTDQRRSSSVPSDLPDRATLVLQFTWTNFGQVSNDSVAVGDVFNTSNQWFEGLEATQQLRLQWPEGWTLVQSPPVGVQNRSLVWNGPRSFDRDDISATFAGEVGDGDGGGGGTTRTTTTDGGEPRAEFPWLPVGAVAALAVAILGFLLLRRSDVRIGGTPDEESATDDSRPVASESDSDDAAAGPGGEVSAEAEAEDVDEDLLSDEERVERLLERNGGRMKQANIVKETGWSNA
ncbi:MAG: hypothetical protein V5A24_07065, partial [Haloarculaceae archaeon]